MGKVISPINGGNYIGVIYNPRILTFDPNMDTYQYREGRYDDLTGGWLGGDHDNVVDLSRKKTNPATFFFSWYRLFPRHKRHLGPVPLPKRLLYLSTSHCNRRGQIVAAKVRPERPPWRVPVRTNSHDNVTTRTWCTWHHDWLPSWKLAYAVMRGPAPFLPLQAIFMLCSAFGVAATAVQEPKDANKKKSFQISNYEFWTEPFWWSLILVSHCNTIWKRPLTNALLYVCKLPSSLVSRSCHKPVLFRTRFPILCHQRFNWNKNLNQPKNLTWKNPALLFQLPLKGIGYGHVPLASTLRSPRPLRPRRLPSLHLHWLDATVMLSEPWSCSLFLLFNTSTSATSRSTSCCFASNSCFCRSTSCCFVSNSRFCRWSWCRCCSMSSSSSPRGLTARSTFAPAHMFLYPCFGLGGSLSLQCASGPIKFNIRA